MCTIFPLVFWLLVAQSCPSLYEPVDCSPPGSSVCGIFQARTLEWPAISFSRGPSPPRDRTQASCSGGRFFTIQATREALEIGRTQVFSPLLYNYCNNFPLSDTLNSFMSFLRLSCPLQGFFKNYLFLLIFAALGLHCFAWAFSSCGEWGLLLLRAQ